MEPVTPLIIREETEQQSYTTEDDEAAGIFTDTSIAYDTINESAAATIVFSASTNATPKPIITNINVTSSNNQEIEEIEMGNNHLNETI